MLLQAKSITMITITIIRWQKRWSWWWQWRWWWLVPNIDGDGMLLQVQDRKYWSRPTPTTMCVHYVQYCTKVQNILHNVHYHLQKKYRIFCTRRTNIYKKVQNIEVHKYTILLLLCSVHTSLPRPLVQCAMHYKSTNNIIQKHAKDTSFLRYDNVLLQIDKV